MDITTAIDWIVYFSIFETYVAFHIITVSIIDDKEISNSFRNLKIKNRTLKKHYVTRNRYSDTFRIQHYDENACC